MNDKLKSGTFPIVYADKDFYVLEEVTHEMGFLHLPYKKIIYTIWHKENDEMLGSDVYVTLEQAKNALKETE